VPIGESWRDVLAPQALDLALLGAFLALAMTGFFLKSVRVKYATLVAAVAYMGFSKSHLISVVDLFGVIDRNLPIARYNLAYYALGVFVIASTVLWGRVYCGRICAFGALTQLMDAILPKRLRVEPPAFIERRAAWIKYGLLAAVLIYYVATRDLLVYRFVEPFWMFGLFGTTAMWLALGILLIATVFVRNLYCRFLCPVGALLGIISNLTVFKIKRWSECNTCRICEKTCEWGAIRGPTIIESECVRCDDCERLYHDRKKCPHWIILLKARPSAPPPARAAASDEASPALGSST
jgi:NosR/NirI family nitrous oxide reductase transcriptional regulator